MISVEEATWHIQSNLYRHEVISVPLNKALGMVLADNISADRELPPFNRVMMDGIAIHSAALNHQDTFEIESVQYAGSEQLSLIDQRKCIEVMTGAMLPKGTNAVIRYEDVEINDGSAKVLINEINEFQNVHLKGTDVSKGDLLISQGSKIDSAEIGVLATVGRSSVKVFRPLKAAVISTGDELVSIDQKPLPHQIRQSNSHVLKAEFSKLGIEAGLFHIIDNKEKLKARLSQIFTDFDVIVLSGGVSKGKKDFIPEVMEELGVEKLFHRVAQRPGKPFWYGLKDGKSIFALPGNPVSTFLCFHKYIKPWVNRSLGLENTEVSAILDDDIVFEPPLTYFLQVKLDFRFGHLIAKPVKGKGSGDLANLLKADGFLELTQVKNEFAKGESYPLITYRTLG